MEDTTNRPAILQIKPSYHEERAARADALPFSSQKPSRYRSLASSLQRAYYYVKDKFIQSLDTLNHTLQGPTLTESQLSVRNDLLNGLKNSPEMNIISNSIINTIKKPEYNAFYRPEGYRNGGNKKAKFLNVMKYHKDRLTNKIKDTMVRDRLSMIPAIARTDKKPRSIRSTQPTFFFEVRQNGYTLRTAGDNEERKINNELERFGSAQSITKKSSFRQNTDKKNVQFNNPAIVKKGSNVLQYNSTDSEGEMTGNKLGTKKRITTSGPIIEKRDPIRLASAKKKQSRIAQRISLSQKYTIKAATLQKFEEFKDEYVKPNKLDMSYASDPYLNDSKQETDSDESSDLPHKDRPAADRKRRKLSSVSVSSDGHVSGKDEPDSPVLNKKSNKVDKKDSKPKEDKIEKEEKKSDPIKLGPMEKASTDPAPLLSFINKPKDGETVTPIKQGSLFTGIASKPTSTENKPSLFPFAQKKADTTDAPKPVEDIPSPKSIQDSTETKPSTQTPDLEKKPAESQAKPVDVPDELDIIPPPTLQRSVDATPKVDPSTVQSNPAVSTPAFTKPPLVNPLLPQTSNPTQSPATSDPAPGNEVPQYSVFAKFLQSKTSSTPPPVDTTQSSQPAPKPETKAASEPANPFLSASSAPSTTVSKNAFSSLFANPTNSTPPATNTQKPLFNSTQSTTQTPTNTSDNTNGNITSVPITNNIFGNLSRNQTMSVPNFSSMTGGNLANSGANNIFNNPNSSSNNSGSTSPFTGSFGNNSNNNASQSSGNNNNFGGIFGSTGNNNSGNNGSNNNAGGSNPFLGGGGSGNNPPGSNPFLSGGGGGQSKTSNTAPSFGGNLFGSSNNSGGGGGFNPSSSMSSNPGAKKPMGGKGKERAYAFQE